MKRLNKLAKVALVFVPAILWIPAAALLSFEGAWMTPVAEQNDDKAFMARAKQAMSENLKNCGDQKVPLLVQ